MFPQFLLAPLLPGPTLKNNIAEYKSTTANTSDLVPEALVDGDVVTHGENCTNATTTGAEVVTWTLDLKHEYYLHALRIYNTGCGELERTVANVKPRELLFGFEHMYLESCILSHFDVKTFGKIREEPWHEGNIISDVSLLLVLSCHFGRRYLYQY